MLALAIISTVFVGLAVLFNLIKIFSGKEAGPTFVALLINAFIIVTIWVLFAHIG